MPTLTGERRPLLAGEHVAAGQVVLLHEGGIQTGRQSGVAAPDGIELFLLAVADPADGLHDPVLLSDLVDDVINELAFVRLPPGVRDQSDGNELVALDELRRPAAV